MSLDESVGITDYVKKKNNQTSQVPQKLSGKLGLPMPSLQHQTNLMSLGKVIIIKFVRLLNVVQLRG